MGKYIFKKKERNVNIKIEVVKTTMLYSSDTSNRQQKN